MVFQNDILAGSSGTSTAVHTIGQSIRFNDDDTANMTRTFGSGNQKIWTMSFWVKRCTLGTGQRIISRRTGGGSTTATMGFNSSNEFNFYDPSNGGELVTDRTFEDTSKFYHFLIRYEASNGTQEDTIQIYVDGDRQTFQSAVNITDTNGNFNANVVHAIGKYQYNNSEYLDAYLAEVNWIDGTNYGPETFGVTDTSTGRWVPKTLSGITYGTNGFRLQFLDSTHAGIDTSGNGNTFTANNLIESTSKPIAMGGTAFDTGSAGAWDSSYPVANGFKESTAVSNQAIYNDGSTAIGGVIGWDFGSGRSANIQTVKINSLAVNNSITGFAFEYSDNGSDYTSVGTFSVSASASEQTVSVTNTAGKHRYWRLRATTDTSGGQSSYRWVVGFLGFFSEPVTTDSPTQNHNTFADVTSGASLSQGNLTVSTGTSGGAAQAVAQPSFGVNTGKWYWEVQITTVGAGLWGWKDDGSAGGSQASNSGTQGSGNFSGALSTGASGQYDAGSWFIDHEYTKEVNYTTVEENDVLMFAIDLDSGKGFVGKAISGSGGTTGWFNSGNPATGAGDVGGCHRANGVNKFYPCAVRSDSNSVGEYNFGQRTFAATPPDGFSAIQQDNIPTTERGVTGFTWIKSRDNSSSNHGLYDSSRGPGFELRSNLTSANPLKVQGVSKFLKGGVAVGNKTNLNAADESIVAWNWVANAGTTESISASSSTDIDIDSVVQKNTTAGFSIVQWTGNNASTAGIGHGLSAAPEWILVKNLSDATNWFVYHHKFTADQNAKLDDVIKPGSFTTGKFDYSEIDATRFEVAQGGSDANSVNGSGDSMIAYCWHGVDGFSKFGKYNGNGHADGPFIYTGFLPAWIMFKEIGNNQNWPIWDGARFRLNPTNNSLFSDLTQGDNSSSIDLDVLSNGFKPRTTNNQINRSTGVYAYMAFAKNPFNGDGTSFVTAR